MGINRLLNLNYLRNNSDVKLQNQNLQSMSTGSIFGLMSNCIQKADTSGDGILSEEEISVFMTSGYNEVISEFQNEFENSGQEINVSFLSQIKDLLGQMLKSSDKIQEDISNLEGMSKDDFLKNATEAQNNDDASVFWQLMGMDDAEGIFNNLDVDGDGILSTEELETIASLDSDKNSISLQDLSDFLGNEDDNLSIEDTPEVAETQQIGSSNLSSMPYSGSFMPPTNKENIEKRTVDTINKEIAEQEELKNTTKEQAEAAIAAQDELIQNALQQSDLCEEFKEEYNAENERLTNAIKTKEDEISKENH